MIVGWLESILDYWLSAALLVILMLLAFLLPGEAIEAAKKMMRTAWPCDVVPRIREMLKNLWHDKGQLVRSSRGRLNIWAVCVKTFHFCAFALLSFLIFRGLDLSSGLSDRRVVLYSLGASITLGVATECGQRWLAGRGGTLRDVLINTLGSMTGVYLFWLWPSLREL